MAIETKTIISVDTKQAESNIGNLKARMREVREQMNRLAEQGDRTSEAYQKLAQEAGRLAKAQREVSKDVQEASTTFSNTVSYLSGSLAGVSGAVSAVTGALTVMGVEADKDSKMMKTLVAAMSITSGLQAIQNSVESFKLLYNNIKRATQAQTALNVVMKASPYALVAAAAAAAIALIVKHINEEKEKLEEVKKAAEEHRKEYEALQKAVNGNNNPYEIMASSIRKYADGLKDANAETVRQAELELEAEKTEMRKLRAREKWLQRLKDTHQINKRELEELNTIQEQLWGDGGMEQSIKLKAGIIATFKNLPKETEEEVTESGKKIGNTVAKAIKDGLTEEQELELAGEEIGNLIWRGLATSSEKNDFDINEFLKPVSPDETTEGSFDTLREKAAELFTNQDGIIDWVALEEWLAGLDSIAAGYDYISKKILEAKNNQMNGSKTLLLTENETYKGVMKLAGNVGSALGAIANNLEEDTEEFKNLKAAEAIINTLSAAVAAFAGITKDTGGWGIAAAIAEMVGVIATGMATVKQIYSVKTDGGKNSSNYSANTSAVQAVTNTQSNVRLTNGDGSVYNMDDITNKMSDIKVILSTQEVIEETEKVKRVRTRSQF